jgi:16S rRNA (uracil1498-N3)-methyltransferase
MFDKLFYHSDLSQKEFELSDSEAKHISQVLRYKVGDELNLTDGLGTVAKVSLVEVTKRKVLASIVESKSVEEPIHQNISVAVGIVKSSDRLEWMVEKLTELGIGEILFLDCERNERKKLNLEKLERKAISAMKQSGQAFKPQLSFLKWDDLFDLNFDEKFIAHCESYLPENNLYVESKGMGEKLVCIGPEGDFSQQELDACIEKGFKPVNLGETRLRTETAALIAAHSLSLSYAK